MNRRWFVDQSRRLMFAGEKRGLVLPACKHRARRLSTKMSCPHLSSRRIGDKTSGCSDRRKETIQGVFW